MLDPELLNYCILFCDPYDGWFGIWLVPSRAMCPGLSFLLNSCSSRPLAYLVSAGIMFVQEEALASSLSSTDSLPPEDRPIAQDCSDSLESIPTGQVNALACSSVLFPQTMMLLRNILHSGVWPGEGMACVARASGGTLHDMQSFS